MVDSEVANYYAWWEGNIEQVFKDNKTGRYKILTKELDVIPVENEDILSAEEVEHYWPEALV